MIDPDEHERDALQFASENAGEYLDTLGETDLARLTVEQWMTLIEVVVTSYQERLQELLGDGHSHQRGK